MLASVCTRSPVTLPWASSAMATWLSVSRPCVAERKSSIRVAAHFTGRPSSFAA